MSILIREAGNGCHMAYALSLACF
uniref:Uncharacterized protein n=1 Tax=Arundo donax TaxID=35708 RepID=A0A0A8YXU9_ARUDO